MNRNNISGEKLIYHIRESKYAGSLPFFYSDQDFPELKLIKNNWETVWQEVKDYEKNLGNITGMSVYLPPNLTGENAWNNIYFDNYMWRFHDNREHFPKTCELLSQISGCTHSGISVISPNSSIDAHYGDTNGVIRCHLALHIPAPYPVCGIRVGEEERGWKDGELVIFTEAHNHRAWNHSSERRYVMVFDIVHPKWATEKYSICAHVLGAQTFVFFEQKFPVLKRIPDRHLHFIHECLSLLWRAYLPIQRRLKFL